MCTRHASLIDLAALSSTSPMCRASSESRESVYSETQWVRPRTRYTWWRSTTKIAPSREQTATWTRPRSPRRELTDDPQRLRARHWATCAAVGCRSMRGCLGALGETSRGTFTLPRFHLANWRRTRRGPGVRCARRARPGRARALRARTARRRSPGRPSAAPPPPQA